MTPPDDPIDDQERALGALFDRTATPPSESVMRRLENHAADVAAEGVRQRWLTSRIVWPLAVAAGIAAAYLVVAPSKPESVRVAPAPVATVHPAPTAPVAPSSEQEPADEDDDDIFAALEDPAISDPFDLSLLMDEEL